MPIGVGRIYGKRVTYTQIRFELYPPLAFKKFSSCENLLLWHVCVTDQNLSFGVPLLTGSCHFSDPYESQISGDTVVFSVGSVFIL